VVDELIDAMRLVPGGVAVDVGCGTGALTRRLARRVGPTGRVVGADINAYLLREASAIAQHQELGDVLPSKWAAPRHCRSRMAASTQR
jgi:ubiquinone/menaquinone biosynthesis C-methylase UbiE